MTISVLQTTDAFRMTVVAVAGILATATLYAQDEGRSRGEYLLHAGGCITCHT
jgi:hypothetical protein